MFGFVKRRIAKEHFKLVYQNDAAYSFMKSQDMTIEIETYQFHDGSIYNNWSPGKLLDPDMVEYMLGYNKKMRKFYSVHPLSRLKHFDKQFEPIRGWDETYRYELSSIAD